MIAPLALTLLVLGIFTDNHDLTLAFNDFALFADFLDRRSDFHLNYTSSKIFLYLRLFGSPCYAALRQVVGRHFDRDLIPGENTDVVHP